MSDEPERCEGCRFWQLYDMAVEEDNEPGGFCRRYPPVGNDDDLQPEWPETFSFNWCGEFQPITKKVQLPSWDEFISGLTTRAINTLKGRRQHEQRIESLDQLCSMTEDDLSERRETGDATIIEIKRRLAYFGLKLRNW